MVPMDKGQEGNENGLIYIRHQASDERGEERGVLPSACTTVFVSYCETPPRVCGKGLASFHDDVGDISVSDSHKLEATIPKSCSAPLAVFILLHLHVKHQIPTSKPIDLRDADQSIKGMAEQL